MKYFFNKKNRRRSPSGFTLIEAFVAITILLVAVLGPLTLITRSITDGNYAKNQVVSFYLLQEGLDLVSARAKQLVDSGEVVDFASTDSRLSLDLNNNCTLDNACVIYFDDASNDIVIKRNTPSDFSVYRSVTAEAKDFTYSQNPGLGTKTIFTRKIWFENIKDPEGRLGSGENGFGLSDDIFGKKATVEVLWSSRGITRSATSSVMLYE